MSTVMRRQLLQEMQKTFPVNVQGRVTALKNVQLEQLELEAKFYEDVRNIVDLAALSRAQLSGVYLSGLSIGEKVSDPVPAVAR